MKEEGKKELVAKEMATFKTSPALHYEYYSTEQGRAGALILINATLYKVEVTFPLDHPPEKIESILSHLLLHFTPLN